jgi:hypothetical protein
MMLLACLRILAIVSVALYLVPTGAHLFELSHKLALMPPDYMMVQGIYQGWSLFGIVLLAALILTLLHAVMRRQSRGVAIPSLCAFLCLTAALVVFLVFTLPMNVASSNWTVTPEPFETARRQWEYSHAASAVLTFLALIAISAAVSVDAGGRFVQPRSSEPSE